MPRNVLIILLLIAVTVGLRGLFVVNTDVKYLLSGDAYEYLRLALNLKLCGVFNGSLENLVSGCNAALRHDFGRAPGFPVMIMPIVEWPPTISMIRNIQILHIVFGVASVLLVYLLLYRKSMLLAFSAAMLTALSPHLVVASLNLITEASFTFVIMVFVAFTWMCLHQPTIFRAVLVGVSLGLLTYIRPTTIYLVVLIAPFLGFAAQHHKLRTAVIVAGAFLISFGPWMVLSDGYATDQGSGSLMVLSIHNGTYPDLTVAGIPESRGKPHRHDPTYAERDTLVKVIEGLIARAKASPSEYLSWYAYGKTKMFFDWDVVAGFGDVFIYPVRFHGYENKGVLDSTHRLMWNLHWPLHIAGLAACVLIWLWPRSEPRDETQLLLRMISLIIVYFVAVHIVATPLPRYSVPLRPLIYMMATWLVFAIVRLPFRRRAPENN